MVELGHYKNIGCSELRDDNFNTLDQMSLIMVLHTDKQFNPSEQVS